MDEDIRFVTVQELLGHGYEHFSEECYRRALGVAISTIGNAAVTVTSGNDAATTSSGIESALQSLFEVAELVLQRLARWAKEGLVDCQRCVELLLWLTKQVAESLQCPPCDRFPGHAVQDAVDIDRGTSGAAFGSGRWVFADRLLVMLYGCCVRTLCHVDSERVHWVLSEPNQGLERFSWQGEAYLPMIQVYAELRERWLLRQDPVSIHGQVKATEHRVQNKILNEMVWICNGAALTALSQQLLQILQQALRIDWWWHSAGYELETAPDWARVLRYVLAAAPVSALSDILCLVEMEALAEPALGEILLSSLGTEIDSLASKRMSLSASLRVDLSLCFRLAEAEAASTLAQEKAAMLLWQHGQPCTAAASGEANSLEPTMWAPEPVLSEILQLPGMEHAASSIAELAFRWMQLSPGHGVRTLSDRLKGTGRQCRSLRPNQLLAIRRRGRRRTHEQISPRSFFLQRCAVQLLTELFGHHGGARKEILSACLSAIAEPDFTLPTRAAYCTVIERVASSPAHRVHLRDLSECLLLWLRQLMIEFPISLAKRLLAALAPLGALWQPMGDGLLLFLRKMAASRAIRARRIAAHGLACLLVAPYLSEPAEVEITQLLLRTLDLAPAPLRAEIFLAMGSAVRARVPRLASLSLWMTSLSQYVKAVTFEQPSELASMPRLDLHRCFHAAGVAIEALPELFRCMLALPLAWSNSHRDTPATASATTSRGMVHSPELESTATFLVSFIQRLVSDLSEPSMALRMLALDLLLQRRASAEQLLAPIERIRIAESRCQLLERCYETLLDVGPFSSSQQAALLVLYGQLVHLSDSLLPVLANAAARHRSQATTQPPSDVSTTNYEYIARARPVTRQVLADSSRLFLWTPSTVSAAELASDLAYASSRQDSEHGGFLHDTLSWAHVVPALSAERTIQLLMECKVVYGAAALIRILRRHLDIEVYFRDLRGNGDFFDADQTWPAWLRQSIILALLQLVTALPDEPCDSLMADTSLQSAFFALDLECSSVVRDSIDLQRRPAFARLWLKAYTLDFLAALVPRWPAALLTNVLTNAQVRRELRPILETEFPEWRDVSNDDESAPASALQWIAALLTRRLRADFHRGLTVKLVSIYVDLIAHIVAGSVDISDASEKSSERILTSPALNHIERDLQGILFDFEIPQANVYRLLLRPFLLVLGSEKTLALSTALIRVCRQATSSARAQAAISDHPLVNHFMHASNETRMAVLWAIIEFGAEKMPRVRVKTQVARAVTLREKDLLSVSELLVLLEAFFAPGELAISVALFMRALALAQQALHYLQGVCEMLRRQLTFEFKRGHKKPRRKDPRPMLSLVPEDEIRASHWATVLRHLPQCRTLAHRLGQLIRPDAVREALQSRSASSRSANQACARFVYRQERFEAECSQLTACLACCALEDRDMPAILHNAVRRWLDQPPATTAAPTAGLLTFSFLDWEQASTTSAKSRAPTRRVCYLRSRNAYIDHVLQHEGADEAYADLEDFIATEEETNLYATAPGPKAPTLPPL
jgi:hypothetical protein